MKLKTWSADIAGSFPDYHNKALITGHGGASGKEQFDP